MDPALYWALPPDPMTVTPLPAWLPPAWTSVPRTSSVPSPPSVPPASVSVVPAANVETSLPALPSASSPPVMVRLSWLSRLTRLVVPEAAPYTMVMAPAKSGIKTEKPSAGRIPSSQLAGSSQLPPVAPTQVAMSVARSTWIVMVARRTFPAPSSTSKVKVSTPSKEPFGVYVKVPSPLSVTVPFAGCVTVATLITSPPRSKSRLVALLVLAAPANVRVPPRKRTSPVPSSLMPPIASVPMKLFTPLAVMLRSPPTKARVANSATW